MLCKTWGILKRLSAQPEWRKKLASTQSMVEKNFLPPRFYKFSYRVKLAFLTTVLVIFTAAFVGCLGLVITCLFSH